MEPIDWDEVEAEAWRRAQDDSQNELNQVLFITSFQVGKLCTTVDELVYALNLLEGRLNAIEAALRGAS